ncbi:hypothetical protein SGLAM104S_10191 [Streptomyces glaucescens]
MGSPSRSSTVRTSRTRSWGTGHRVIGTTNRPCRCVRDAEVSAGPADQDDGIRTLTPAGERLRGWARSLLDTAEQAVHDVRNQRRRIRLGALETLAGSTFPSYSPAWPNTGRTSTSTRTPTAPARGCSPTSSRDASTPLCLDSGEHLGGLGFPAPAEPLAFIDLVPVPLALVAAPTHALAGRAALTPADFDRQRLLVNVPECSFWMAAQRILGDAPERVRAGGVAVMRAWAEHGLGVTLLPHFAVAGSAPAPSSGSTCPCPTSVCGWSGSKTGKKHCPACATSCTPRPA